MNDLQDNINEKRMAIAFVVLLITSICAGFSTYIIVDSKRHIHEEVASQEQAIRSLVRTIEKLNSEKYKSRIKSFLTIKSASVKEKIIKAFADRDRQELLRLSAPFYNLFKSENKYFAGFSWVLPDNSAFLRVQKPKIFGDDISKIRPDIVRVNRDFQQTSGYIPGYTGLAYRVAQPVTYQGEHLGVLQFSLGEHYLIDTIKEELNISVVQVIPNKTLQTIKFTKLPYYTSSSYIVQSRDLDMIKSAGIDIDWSVDEQHIDMSGRTHSVSKVIELLNFKGEPEGSLFVLLDISEHIAEMKAGLAKVILASIFLIALSLFVITKSYGKMIKKIMDLNQSLEKNNIALESRVLERTAKLQHSEKHLKESEAKFRGLVEFSCDWIWEMDKNGIYTYSSPQVEQILGYKPEAIIGKTPFDFMPPEKVDKVTALLKGVLKAAAPIVALENVALHKDGHQVILETSGAPFFNETGEVSGYRGIDRDITERKNTERQLQQSQKMEAIGTLSGGIAHDFNNILSAILGFADLALMDVKEDSSLYSSLKHIRVAGGRAKDLVAQILAFSRQEGDGQIILKPQPIVKEALKLIKSSIPTTIELIENIDPSCGTIDFDPTQLHQIVMNLCTNAYHAMEKTGGEITIVLKEVTLTKRDVADEDSLDPGKYMRLTINDTGTGIEPDIQKRIFDPFFTTKEVGKGTGLGLSVVHGIVKSSSGTIKCQSKLGHGTSFDVFLPVVQGDIQEQPDVEESIPTGTERILLVDDVEMLTILGKHMLELLGYTVTVETSSINALEMFRSQPDGFDLVITDQTMPLLTGGDMAREMLRIRPDLPIILCTGYSNIISEDRAKTIGIREFVEKPIERQKIAQVIRKVFAGEKGGPEK